MSDTDADHEGQKQKDVFSTLLAVGDCLFLKGVYNKAIDSYTTALSIRPDDKTCFVGRSKCFMKMGQFENALKDAEASLKEDKTYFKGLYQKAEALYYMGKFEFALVFYHRGQKLRPLMQEFKLGIQKAEGAIENSVGSPSSVKLEIKGGLTLLREEEKREQPIHVTQHPTTKQQNQKNPKCEKTTKQLLGEFYSDKKFLENLLNHECDLAKGKTKGGERLQDVIQSCLSSLDTCTKFLSQKKPISAPEGQHKQKCCKPHRRPPSEPALFLLKSLEEIDKELTSGNAEGSLKKAEEVMKTLQGWSETDLPNKKEVLGSLHSCVGKALMDLGDWDKALEHHKKDLELASHCKLTQAMSRALDNIGQIYAQTGQYTQAIDVWEKKVPLVFDVLEKTWLFHNIGWCYLELKRHHEARDYGIRSFAAAEEIADVKWQINANVLVAQAELKLKNFESCISYFERALSKARLQDDHCAVNAIQKALDEAKQHLHH